MAESESANDLGQRASHFVILGQGALGSVYGVRMASLRGRVSFVVRPERVTLSSPLTIERTSKNERHTLQHPALLARIPSDVTAIAIAVRADNVNSDLDQLLQEAPSVPVISLTPLLPSALEHLRSTARGPLVVAMPGVVAYTHSSGVIRYWLPRASPTLVDASGAKHRAVVDVCDWMSAAGIPTRLETHVDTMNPATTISFLPLVLLLDAAGGTAEQALARPSLLRLSLEAVDECRKTANHIGTVPGWAQLLGRFVGARSLRLGVALAQRTFPESVHFVEQHFGSKTHAQNVILAQEVITLGEKYEVKMPALRELTDRCAQRSGDRVDG